MTKGNTEELSSIFDLNSTPTPSIPSSRYIIKVFLSSNLPHAKLNIKDAPTIYGKMRVFLHRNPHINNIVGILKRNTSYYLYRKDNVKEKINK